MQQEKYFHRNVQLQFKLKLEFKSVKKQNWDKQLSINYLSFYIFKNVIQIFSLKEKVEFTGAKKPSETFFKLMNTILCKTFY